MKNIFVTGTSGAQGQTITAVLARAGHRVLGISRNPESTDDLVDLTRGDLENLNSVIEAMDGADAVVLTLPLLFDSDMISAMTRNVVEAAKKLGIKKIIYNTGIPLGKQKTGYAAIDVKHDALSVLEQSGLEVVTLMPTIYLDNLTAPFLLPVIREHGIVPYPLAEDFNFSWISQDNLGRFCLDALTNEALVGKKVVISNGDNLAGAELAKILSEAAKKTLTYVPSSPDDFEQNLKPVLGDYVAKEISNLYRGIEENHADFLNSDNQTLIEKVELQSTLDWAKQAGF